MLRNFCFLPIWEQCRFCFIYLFIYLQSNLLSNQYFRMLSLPPQKTRIVCILALNSVFSSNERKVAIIVQTCIFPYQRFLQVLMGYNLHSNIFLDHEQIHKIALFFFFFSNSVSLEKEMKAALFYWGKSVSPCVTG